MRRKEEGRRQTTTALGQPGRERETNKEIEFTQKDFFQQYGLSSWSFRSRQKQTPFLLNLSVLINVLFVIHLNLAKPVTNTLKSC